MSKLFDMEDFYGSSFKYGDFISTEFGNLIIANIETSRFDNLKNDGELVTTFNKGTNRKSIIGINHEATPLSFEIEIVTCNAEPLSRGNRSIAEAALFKQNKFRKLYILDQQPIIDPDITDVRHKYLNCIFQNPQKIENGSGVIGYKATLVADSNMYWVEPLVRKVSSPTNPFSISVNTDSVEYTYPLVKIQVGATGGEVSIINQTDSPTRMSKFSELQKKANVVYQGGINYVSGDYYTHFVNRNFIRLLPGENKFIVTGDVESIEFEFNERRFL